MINKPNNAPKGPLSHIRVLDLTEFLAGPYCTMILGDLGAEIIKVEAFGGDSSRHVPPHYIAGSSTYYTAISRNKKSIIVNLKEPEGLALVKELTLSCDILVENRRPGVIERLGLRYEDITLENPGLIWCSISGFGQNGPDRDRAAYDMIVQGMSGVMSLTGEKGGKPVRAGVPIGDTTAGMYGVIGILAALASRSETAKGDYIDISMFDVQLALLTYQAAAYLHSGKVAGPQGREHDFIPTYRCFEAGDGIDVAVTANTQKMWLDLCDVLEMSHLKNDDRFKTNKDRLINQNELVPLLNDAFKQAKADEWVDRLLEKGISAGPVNDIERALNEPQTIHRGMIAELIGEEEDQRARVMGNPINIRHSGRSTHSYPPPLGAETRSILTDILGYNNEKINALIKCGAIAERENLNQKESP
jgi:CoA:oxalate CoA-transferase